MVSATHRETAVGGSIWLSQPATGHDRRWKTASIWSGQSMWHPKIFETEDTPVIQRRADFSAAWSLFAFLQAQFRSSDTRCTNRLPGVQEKHKIACISWPTGWRRYCSKDGPPARFIDNRASSFLAQLPHAIHAVADSTPRNYLAMGSGFFEGGLPNRQLPAVLGKIVATLREHRALTGTANIDVFVNPAACQVVASALPAMGACKVGTSGRQRAWLLCSAAMPAAAPPPIPFSVPAKNPAVIRATGHGFISVRAT